MTRAVLVRDVGSFGPRLVVDRVAEFPTLERAIGWTEGWGEADETVTAIVEGDPTGSLADLRADPNRAPFVPAIEAALRGERG